MNTATARRRGDRLPLFVMEDGDSATVDLAKGQVIDWGVHAIGADMEWARSRGEGVKVAVLDTGGTDHPDVAANVDACTGGMDAAGHGTHVAGIIGGIDNDIGVVGVAPGCRLLLSKVLPADVDGLCAALRGAADAGARVVNLSVGMYEDCPDFHAAIKEVYARGVVLVAAAGNDPSRVSFPGCYPEVICVTAIDEHFNRASFAPLTENHIAMPGVSILSTWLGGQYARLSGTSQATPLLTGEVALIIALNKPSLAETPQVVQAALKRIEQSHDQVFFTPNASLL